MAKIRVHELAKELGIPSKDMVTRLQGLGLDVKNHMSTLEESQASWVKNRVKGKSEEKNQQVEKIAYSKEEAGKRESEKSKSPPIPSKKHPQDSRQTSPVKGMPASRDRIEKKEEPRKVQNRPQDKNASMQKNREQQGAAGLKKSNDLRAQEKNYGKNIPHTVNKQTAKSNNRPAHLNANSTAKSSNRPAHSNANSAAKSSNRPAHSNANSTAKNNNRPVNLNANTTADKSKQKKTGFQQTFRKDYSRPQKKSKHKRKKENTVVQLPELIAVEESIMVRELAEKLHKTPAEIVKKLMELGTMASINQLIDFETAEIVASFYEVRVERAISEEEKILEEIVDEEISLKHRPPVVTVMGHVDHGKTSLLDRIRKANVVSGEAGGITQHIGAYQVKINDNKITFIDTPGHEAFTAMRARGANLTDIVVLVVAADDGVMPQTVEAINHIKAAKVPFIVAVNKMDKPEAKPERVMQQLAEYSIVSEEWGGDIIFVPVSAKTGEGIENLLEMILLLAEMHEIRANPERAAEGVVIEGELDKGRGAIATVLVLKGTLKVGDFVICGVNWCKVRAMTDDRGRRVEQAYPSMPVEIMGWSDVPEAGGRVQVCDEKIAKEISSLRLSEKKIEEQKQSSRVSLDDFFKHMQDSESKELNLILKGDVQGSIEALAQSLLRLSTDEVKVNVIHSAVGAITETDVMLASASNGIIIGFNVRPESKARKHAEDENIDVRLYRVIYETIEDVKKAMSGLLDPEYKEKFLGRAEVRATFKVPNVGTIAGSYVFDGKIQRNANVRILRDGVIIYEGMLSSLKRFKDDVKDVAENYECGIGIKDFNDLKEGDIIEAYTMEEIPREI
jgi:translation initiation factor IF-2